MASNALLTLRLTALYARKPSVVWFLRIFFILSYGATLGLLAVSMYSYGGMTIFITTILSCLTRSKDTMYYNTLVRTCGSLGHSATMPAIFYAPAALECTIFGLTAWRAIQDNKLSGNGLRLKSYSTPFLTMLYRGESENLSSPQSLPSHRWSSSVPCHGHSTRLEHLDCELDPLLVVKC